MHPGNVFWMFQTCSCLPRGWLNWTVRFRIYLLHHDKFHTKLLNLCLIIPKLSARLRTIAANTHCLRTWLLNASMDSHDPNCCWGASDGSDCERQPNQELGHQQAEPWSELVTQAGRFHQLNPRSLAAYLAWPHPKSMKQLGWVRTINDNCWKWLSFH